MQAPIVVCCCWKWIKKFKWKFCVFILVNGKLWTQTIHCSHFGCYLIYEVKCHKFSLSLACVCECDLTEWRFWSCCATENKIEKKIEKATKEFRCLELWLLLSLCALRSDRHMWTHFNRTYSWTDKKREKKKIKQIESKTKQTKEEEKDKKIEKLWRNSQTYVWSSRSFVAPVKFEKGEETQETYRKKVCLIKDEINLFKTTMTFSTLERIANKWPIEIQSNEKKRKTKEKCSVEQSKNRIARK